MTVSGQIRALLIDINGTIFHQGVAIEGAAQAINNLRECGYVLRFLTNTESKTVTETHESLLACGLEIDPVELFTPVVAAHTLLAQIPNARVLPLMSNSLKDMFKSPNPRSSYTHVVVGDCREVLNYELLNEAFQAIRAGATLIGLQRGRYYRTSDGVENIDTGAIVAALEYATGASARLLGKPSNEYFALAAASTGSSPDEVAVVGDDATTDTIGGKNIGATTIQVCTGKYAEQAASGVVANATYIVNSIVDVPVLLEEIEHV
jgi:HAD superfamily hydrolase (TIGR01458 family)